MVIYKQHIESQFLEFKEIYDVYSNKVFNLALSYVQNFEDAEEITQDVFVAVHHSLGSFKQKSNIYTWVYRIAINKCLDFIKAKKRKKRVAFITSIFYEGRVDLKHEILEPNHPGVLLEDKDELNNVFKQINKLPQNQKTAIILQKIHNMRQQEVAEIMNISPKAVGQLIQRAKLNLQK